MQRLATAVTIALLGPGALVAPAQTNPMPVPAVFITSTPGPPVDARRTAAQTAVIDRILSFDADGDDRVAAAELPERMLGVVHSVDQDDDGFLTAEEIPLAVYRKSVGVQERSFLVRRSASSLSEVVHDLKLPHPKHDRALAIVKNYNVPRNLNDSKSIDIDDVRAALKELLDEEEFGDFLAASARLGPRNLDVGVVLDRLNEVRQSLRPDK